jgi:magnesium transporter
VVEEKDKKNEAVEPVTSDVDAQNDENQEILEEHMENELTSALERKDKAAVSALLEEAHPIDLAIALEDVSDSDILFLNSLLSSEQMAEIVEQAEEDLQVRIMKLLDLNKILEVFQYMSKDDIVDILGNMPVNRRKELVRLMKSSDQAVIRNLLGYSETSAGGIMTTEFISMRSTLTVSQALEKVKEIAPRTEEINILYITNERKQLVGTVSLRELLVAENYDQLKDIMEDNVISVEPETDQEDVARLVSKYDLHAIPVVNKRKGIIGIITVDDIIDVIEEENTEDILKLGGVNKEEDVDSTVLESVHMRLPWLLVNLVTAFLASATVSVFEDTISQVVALAASMPIVAGMGGNAATQTLAVVIRGIAIGDIKLHGNEKRILKSIFVGFLNGIVCGIIAGIVVSYMYGNIYLGIIILVAMVANMMIAACVGFIIPVILKACHADPAVASSIFITTFTDVCGFFIFLGLAKMALPYLLGQ